MPFTLAQIKCNLIIDTDNFADGVSHFNVQTAIDFLNKRETASKFSHLYVTSLTVSHI